MRKKKYMDKQKWWYPFSFLLGLVTRAIAQLERETQKRSLEDTNAIPVVEFIGAGRYKHYKKRLADMSNNKNKHTNY